MIICLIWTILCSIFKLLKITSVVLLLLRALYTLNLKNNCALHSPGDTSMHFKHGDIILSGIFQLTEGHSNDERYHVKNHPTEQICMSRNMRYLRHYLAFQFAIEEINKNPNILPIISLGYDIYDTCNYIGQAAQATMRALSGGVKHYWNYKCGDKGKTIAFIGHLLYASSKSISQMLSPYGHPQISYGEKFYNKMNYPFVYHTAHGPNVVNKAIVELLKYFGWTWIGIITDDENELIKASEDLMEESLKSGICVEYIYLPNSRENFDFIMKSEARVVVLYVSFLSHNAIIGVLSHFSKIAIYINDLLSNFDSTEEKYLALFKESLFFVSQKGNIIGLKEVLQKASPAVYPNNKILRDIWQSKFRCVLSYSKSNTLNLCNKNLTLTHFPNLLYDVDNLRTTYSVYLAVYAVAHALNNMYMAENKSGKHHGSFVQRIHPKKVIKASVKQFFFP